MFNFTDSKALTFKNGFPPESPIYDLNGYKLNLIKGGLSVHKKKYCKQETVCTANPNLMELDVSDIPCSSFQEIFDKARECEFDELNCIGLILDQGY